ncbi:MAG: hypothetical protein U0R76_03575 [Candidatus Nanopelagicales bacterium]
MSGSTAAPWRAPRDLLTPTVVVLAVLLGVGLMLVAFVANLVNMLPSEPAYVGAADREQAIADVERARQTGGLIALGCLALAVAILAASVWVVRRRSRRRVFRSPPGWPDMPPGWRPYRGWAPPADWPPAPEGWQFWVDATAAPHA